MLYLLWWLLVAVIVAILVYLLLGLVAVAAVPLAGYLAARTYGRLRRFQNRRVVRSTALGVDGESTLIALRHEVLNATDTVLSSTTV